MNSRDAYAPLRPSSASVALGMALEHLEVADAFQRIEDVFARFAIQQMTIDELLAEIANPQSVHSTTVVVDRLAAASLRRDQRARLRDRLSECADAYLAVGSKAGLRYSLILRRLLPKLTSSQAVRLVQPLLRDRRRSRRDVGYSVFRWARIDEVTAANLLSEYHASGDERFLKILVAARGAARVVDLIGLMSEFDDRYWRMRILQATLADNIAIPARVVSRHPTEFLQAAARMNHQGSVKMARQLFARSRHRNDPRFVAWFAWAMFKLGCVQELVAIKRQYNQLRARHSSALNSRDGSFDDGAAAPTRDILRVEESPLTTP